MQPCTQKLWYNRGNRLMTLSITNWDKHCQKHWLEPVPSWVLKDTEANELTRTAQNCKVQDDLSQRSTVFHSAVAELIKGLRTRRCVRFWCKYLDVYRWSTFKRQFCNFHSVGTKAAMVVEFTIFNLVGIILYVNYDGSRCTLIVSAWNENIYFNGVTL